jgi:hypothetical protein
MCSRRHPPSKIKAEPEKLKLEKIKLSKLKQEKLKLEKPKLEKTKAGNNHVGTAASAVQQAQRATSAPPPGASQEGGAGLRGLRQSPET